MELFQVSDVNPNEATGGGGCACNELKSSDTKGPFLVFYASESASTVSPHTVVCAGCVDAGSREIRCEGRLAAGERDPVEETTASPTPGKEVGAPVYAAQDSAPDDFVPEV